VKTGLPHSRSRVEFGEFFFIPLDADKHPYGLDDRPRERAELYPVSDRKLFDLIGQFSLRLFSSFCCASATAADLVSNGPAIDPARDIWPSEMDVQYHPDGRLSTFPKNTATFTGKLFIVPHFAHVRRLSSRAPLQRDKYPLAIVVLHPEFRTFSTGYLP
jgi:hypothetical protein